MSNDVCQSGIAELTDFSQPEVKVFELLSELKNLYPSHALPKLLAPLCLDDRVPPDVVVSGMASMWESLKKRFLQGEEFSSGQPISKEQQSKIFAELACLLENALRKSEEVKEKALELYSRNQDHELCVLLAPFIDQSLALPGVHVLMETMQEGLRERFLWDKDCDELEGQEYIMNELLALLDDALLEIRSPR